MLTLCVSVCVCLSVCMQCGFSCCPRVANSKLETKSIRYSSNLKKDFSQWPADSPLRDLVPVALSRPGQFPETAAHQARGTQEDREGEAKSRKLPAAFSWGQVGRAAGRRREVPSAPRSRDV